MDFLKISLKDVQKTPNRPKNINLDDYIEISSKYIRFFKNCWIKYTDKNSLITYQGGFLINSTNDQIVLRNIKQETFELNRKDFIFYCKDTSEQYEIVKELMLEKEKLDRKIHEFNIEKKEFLQQKKIFFSKIKS